MRHGFHFHYTEILSPSRFDRHPDVPPHRFLISLDRFSGNFFSLAFSLNVPPHAVAFPTSGSSIWKPGIPLLFPPAYDLPVYILRFFFDISLDNSCLYSTIHFERFQLRLLYNANQGLKKGGRKTAQKSRDCKYVANKSHNTLLRCM